LQDGYQTVVIYVDFSKAFDVVQHDKLLFKLRAVGIDGELLAWIRNLFSNRTFQTRVNDLLSAVCDLLSGVIQGSVIGPLMFLIYINDLVELLASYNIKVKLFADDAKLYVKVVNDVDVSVLQDAITALVSWAEEWQLSVAIDKCCALHIGKHSVQTAICINNSPLPVVNSCRDLGVTISSDLSPSLYINDIVRRAHQRANLILKCFVSQNVDLLIRAFVTYVRPLLEYNSSVWSPSLKRDITLIEKVQRKFTKRLHGYRDLSYDERLKRLNLDSLELRRIKADLILCYKIIFGVVNLNIQDFFDLATTSTRGHQFKLYKHFSSCSARSSFFSQRVVNIWNRLPVGVNFSTLRTFRKSLDVTDKAMLLDV